MLKNLKGFIIGFILAMVLCCSVNADGIWDKIDVLRNDIKVVVNGQTVTADNFLYNDTTYLPMRAISEALGKTVQYDDTTNTAYIGERMDNSLAENETTSKGKYHAPDPFSVNLSSLDSHIISCITSREYENGVADYIDAASFVELFVDKEYLKNHTNYYDIINRKTTVLNIDNHQWEMTEMNGSLCVLYDTFVDEILPVLGIDNTPYKK